MVDSYSKWLDVEIVRHRDSKAQLYVSVNGFVNMLFQCNWSQIMEQNLNHKNLKTLLKR